MLCSTSFVQHSLQKASNERRELLMVLLLFSSLQWDVHLSRSFRRYPHLTFPSATWKGIHAFSWQHVLPVGIFFFLCKICLKRGIQALLQIVHLWLGLKELPVVFPFHSVFWNHSTLDATQEDKKRNQVANLGHFWGQQLVGLPSQCCGAQQWCKAVLEKKKIQIVRAPSQTPLFLTQPFASLGPGVATWIIAWWEEGLNGVVSMTKWASFGNAHSTIYHFWS